MNSLPQPLLRPLAEITGRMPERAARWLPGLVAAFSVMAAAIIVLPNLGGHSDYWIALASGAAAARLMTAFVPAALPAVTHLLLFAVALTLPLASGIVSTMLLRELGVSGAASLARAALVGVCCLGPLLAVVCKRRSQTFGLPLGVLAATVLVPFVPPLGFVVVAFVGAVATRFLRPSSIAEEQRETSPLASLVAITSGLLLAASLWLVQLWMPLSIVTLASLLLAFSLAAVVSVPARSMPFLLVLAAAALLLAEPLAMRLALTTTATVSTVPLLVAIRLVFGVALLFVPAAGLVSASRTKPIFAVFGCLAFVAMLAAQWPIATVLVASGLLAGLCVVLANWNRLSAPNRQSILLGTALATLAVAVVMGGVSTTNPSAVLFSGSAFSAVRRGMGYDAIIAGVEPRLVETVTDQRGLLTAWSPDGLRTAFRDRGLPRGTMTIDPELAPADAPAVVSVAIPMAVHPQPRHVAILGLGSGETALTAAQYPFLSLNIVETAERFETLENYFGGRATLLDDERIARTAAAVDQLGVLKPLNADVIVLGASLPIFLDAAGQFDVEHYEQIARHLADGGVVSQRLQTPDLTIESFAGLLATLDAVFDEVGVMQNGSAEVLLLAGDLSRFDADAIGKNLSQPHVCRVLADAGLDWATVLEARQLSPNTTRKLAAKAAPFRRIAATTERTLVFDLMDWTPKWRSHSRMWQKLGQPLIEQVDDVVLRRDAISRIEDIRKRGEVQRLKPDQFWAYRATIKDRLQNRPRSAVKQVKGELINGLHPEDERRKEYLVALSEATASQSPADIDRLDRFTEPFDPLVSYFLHGEAADLDIEAGRPGRALSHLTYQIMFAPGDPSVRPILDATELLLDHPDLIADPVRRYDFAVGLLTQLRRRWDGRAANQIRSQLEGFDLDDSVTLTRRMIDRLDEWAAEAETTDHWAARRSTLKRELLGGLASMRTEQGLRYQQLARLRAKLKADSDREAAADAETVNRKG